MISLEEKRSYLACTSHTILQHHYTFAFPHQVQRTGQTSNASAHNCNKRKNASSSTQNPMMIFKLRQKGLKMAAKSLRTETCLQHQRSYPQPKEDISELKTSGSKASRSTGLGRHTQGFPRCMVCVLPLWRLPGRPQEYTEVEVLRTWLV